MRKKHCRRAADNLHDAFPWRTTPFPDLSDAKTDYAKWLEVFLFLDYYGEHGVKNENEK